jgi:hypothetical protein
LEYAKINYTPLVFFADEEASEIEKKQSIASARLKWETQTKSHIVASQSPPSTPPSYP